MSVKKAENEYYNDRFESYKTDLSKSWSLLKDIINKKKKKGQFSSFIVDNKETTDKNVISEAFNKLYTGIGPSLARKIPI